MENKKRIFSVLSIDGGGVRGVVPARILQEIEERAGKPISELFDMIGGTSTGAIIGSSLVIPDDKNPQKPKFSAKDVLAFYHTLAPSVFPEMRFKNLRKFASGALYDPKPLEDALLKNLGDHKVRDSLTSFLVPATDIKNFKPVWISHLKGQNDNSAENWSSMLMRDAVRATTTAPTFFPAKYIETTPNEKDAPHVKHRHALIDGSFFSGNTMEHLLTVAEKIAPQDAEIVIVHVGTGNVEHTLSPEEFNKLGPIGLISKNNGSLLLSLFINMTALDVENDMRHSHGDKFFNFDGSIDPEEDPNAPSLSLDDARPDNLLRLQKFAENIIAANSNDMDRLCQILKSREFTEQRHLESQKALQKLTDMLAETSTVKKLMKLYLKIVRFSSDLENVKIHTGDDEVKELSEKLTRHHKDEIDRMYRILLDKKQHQGKLLNSIKEAGDDLTRIGKKIFIDPFKEFDETPRPPNDNNPPPPPPPVYKPDRPFDGPR